MTTTGNGVEFSLQFVHVLNFFLVLIFGFDEGFASLDVGQQIHLPSLEEFVIEADGVVVALLFLKSV